MQVCLSCSMGTRFVSVRDVMVPESCLLLGVLIFARSWFCEKSFG